MLKRVRTGAVLILLFCIAAVPAHLYSADKKVNVFTIQVGSHPDMTAANTQFDTLIAKMGKENLPFLRIEKVGRFFPLRLGKFENRADADALLASIRKEYPQAIIMDAYFIEKRIKRMNIPAAVQEPVQTEPVQVEPDEEAAAKETDTVGKPEDKPEAVQIPEPPVAVTPEPEKEIPAQERIALLSSLIQNNEFEEALKVGQQGVDKEPENHELNAWYGTALLKSNQPEEALKYFKKASALSPMVADYYNGTGYCLFYLDKYDDAVAAFNQALSINSKHVDALAGLGILYVKMRDRENAVGIYEKLESIDGATAAKIKKMIDDAQL